MTLRVECPKCGHPYKVKPELAGKKMRCRECEAVITVPASAGDDDEDSFLDEVVTEAPAARRRPATGGRSSRSKSSKAATSGAMSGTTKLLIGLGIGAVVSMLICCGGVFMLGRNVAHQIAGGVDIPTGQTFVQWRQGFSSKFIRQEPAPQEYDAEPPPEGVEEILYPSGSLQLKAWVKKPEDTTEPRPAVVFFHGGFALGAGDFTEACRPFLEQGYVVMIPMLRGENGNPGHFELFLGEVDDAKAAIVWLSQQPYVDRNRIYAFGHSIGGGIASLVGLLDEVPVRHTGSSGGLYDHLTFLGWTDILPFVNSPEERSVRLLHGHVRDLQHPHYAYLGNEDGAFEGSAAKLRKEPGADANLFIEMIPGDHFSSFEPAARKYVERIKADRP